METVKAAKANAKTDDFRKGSKTYGKEVNVEFDVPEFTICTTWDEVTKEFSEKSLIAMAQSRQKATAVSGARQLALKAYAPTGEDLAKVNFIRATLAVNKSMTEEQAAAYYDSIATVPV